jgi:predicted RNase H-like nuclease (RuvC/YqgF family)
MITNASLANIFSIAQEGAQSGSSQSALIALIVGITSAVAAAYSIIRQARGDKAAERAAANSVAAQASQQSFEQIMTTVRFQAEQMILKDKMIHERDEKIDELEVQLADADEELGKSKRDNARLRRLVREHGGTP